jgi:hypothetical protein
MKKLILTCLVALVAFTVATPGTSADDVAPAIVAGVGCGFFDANGAFWGSGDGHVVHTQSANGNSNLYCNGTLSPGAVLPTRAMIWTNENTGFICGNGIIQFKGTTTPSGHFSFTCHGP